MSKVTKNAIAMSLKKILDKKVLTKVTINDITKDCGINRMTFYYHFKDIYDLIEWIFIEEAEKVLKDKKTYNTWKQGILNIFKAIGENKLFILNVYNSISKEQLENYLYKIVYTLLISVIEEKCVGMIVEYEKKKFIADFYKYAFVGIILNWIENGMKEEPMKIVNYLDITLSGNIINALNNYHLDKIHQNV